MKDIEVAEMIVRMYDTLPENMQSLVECALQPDYQGLGRVINMKAWGYEEKVKEAMAWKDEFVGEDESVINGGSRFPLPSCRAMIAEKLMEEYRLTDIAEALNLNRTTLHHAVKRLKWLENRVAVNEKEETVKGITYRFNELTNE